MNNIMVTLLKSSTMTSFSFVRAICTTSTALRNKGIEGMVRGLKLEEEVENITPEELDEMSGSSFDVLNQAVGQLEGDAEKLQRQIHYKTIENKYFKSRGPVEENFLTWSMKLQLKYLHSSDPKQWTPEVLANSFPVSPEGAMRLLKSHWAPKTEAEREKHDQRVVARWKRHMKGKLGSFKILEKALNDKFLPENLPAPTMSMKEVEKVLQELRFDGEQPYVPQDLRPKNPLPKQQNMKGKSFQSIIEDYERQTRGDAKEADGTMTTTLDKLSGPPQYDGSYSTIDSGAAKPIPRRRGRKERLVTYAQFMEGKK